MGGLNGWTLIAVVVLVVILGVFLEMRRRGNKEYAMLADQMRRVYKAEVIRKRK